MIRHAAAKPEDNDIESDGKSAEAKIRTITLGIAGKLHAGKVTIRTSERTKNHRRGTLMYLVYCLLKGGGRALF